MPVATKDIPLAMNILAVLAIIISTAALVKSYPPKPTVFYTTLTVEGFAVTKVKTTIIGNDTTVKVQYFTKPGLNDYRNVRVLITKDSM